VLKHGSTTVLGTGTGTINNTNQTADITAWTDKAGLVAGSQYGLKSGGKTYSDARCETVGLPATFTNVV
jgi:hypothetical protein